MTKAKTRYAVVIDGEPGAFGLWVPDMPGCTSMGASVDDLLLKAQEALRMWAEDAHRWRDFARPPELRGNRQGTGGRGGIKGRCSPGHRAAADRNRAPGQGEPVAGRLWLLAAIDAAAARGLTRSAFLSSAAREKIAAEG